MIIGGLLVLIVIFANVVGGEEGSLDDRTTSASTEAAPSYRSSPTSSAPTSTAPEISPAGSAVRDGKFEFRVLDMVQQETWSDPTGNQFMTETAQGVFYVLTVSVTNIGDEARSYFGGNQTLVDTAGREYNANTSIDMWANGYVGDINPGNSIQVTLAFDVAPGTVPALLEVHDSMFSAGTKVLL